MCQTRSRSPCQPKILDVFVQKFVELCFNIHPEAISVKMLKRDAGMVYGKSNVLISSYRLVFGPKGFELMSIEVPDT